MKTSARNSLFAIGLSMLLLGGAAAPAANATTATNAEETVITQIRDGLRDYGVSDNTADALIVKYRDGVTWDSMNGSSPVSVTTKSVSGANETTETYQDGSVKRITVEKPAAETGGVSTRGVRDCRLSTSGSTKTYTGCWVSGGTVLITAGFSVKYKTSPGAASVLATGQESIVILSLGAGWKDVSRKITQANATASAPAKARLSFTATGATFGASSWLEFRVDRNGTTSTGFSF